MAKCQVWVDDIEYSSFTEATKALGFTSEAISMAHRRGDKEYKGHSLRFERSPSAPIAALDALVLRLIEAQGKKDQKDALQALYAPVLRCSNDPAALLSRVIIHGLGRQYNER